MTSTPLLHAAELDDLAGWAAVPLSTEDRRAIEAALADWAPVQTVANLLMNPTALPGGTQVAALLRGLGEPAGSYLRLAAAVGAGSLAAGDLDEAARVQLVQALLDVAAGSTGVEAERAASALIALASPAEAGDLVAMLVHPAPRVRAGIEQALLVSAGTDGIRAVLADATDIPPDVATAVRAALAADGIDLERPADAQRRLPPLSYLPNLVDWDSGGR